MTKKQIFTAAHKMAKTFIGAYSACLSLALKTIYAAMKNETQTVQEMTAAIFKMRDDERNEAIKNTSSYKKYVSNMTKALSSSLNGSEKQVNWAKKILSSKIENLAFQVASYWYNMELVKLGLESADINGLYMNLDFKVRMNKNLSIVKSNNASYIIENRYTTLLND